MKQANLKDIFEAAEATILSTTSTKLQEEREAAFKEEKKMLRDFQKKDDDGFFYYMSLIIFYSGIKAEIVEQKEKGIEKYFEREIDEVAGYDEDKIAKILKDPDIIRNERKIRAIIENARKFQRLRKEFPQPDKGSHFRKYLLTFDFKPDDRKDYQKLDALINDVIRRFDYMGPATARHFLMDHGFPLIKPDRMIMRVLYRLGLVEGKTENYYSDAIAIARQMTATCDVPIRHVDSMLVGIGQVGVADLCRLDEPRCDLCGLKKFCYFPKRK